jgi:uncharacterized protein YjbI with pentapeptide repeats
MDLVERQSFIALLGSSGSGKSSVVLAGLVPALDQISRWKFVYFRPGEDPFYALATALVPLHTPELDEPDQKDRVRELSGQLRDGTIRLSDVVIKIRMNHPQHQILLIADQFEELYNHCPDVAVRHQFLDFLIEVAQTDSPKTRFRRDITSSPLVLVLTLRADFLGQALTYRPFAELLQDSDLKLGPLNRGELEEVIVKPLKQMEVSFETGLVERILDDVDNRPGSLPRVESALDLLWHNRDDGPLTCATYEAIGGVEAAVATFADRAFNQLVESEKQQARHIFSLLVLPGEGTEDSGRVALRAQVGEDNWPVVKRLAEARLVVIGRTPDDEETVELVHEALIWGWERLQGWISAERNFLTWLKGLRFALDQWQASRQDKGALLRDTLLTEAEAWLNVREPDLGQAERDFIQASVTLREEEKRLQLAFELVTEGAAERNLSGVDLHGANLSGADLSQIDLPGTNLDETDLFGANLSGTDLSRASLSGAILIKAQLRETDLSGADLTGAKLSGADLSGANLSQADLSGANLSKADLSQANLSGAKLNETKLSGTKLSGAILDDDTRIDDKWHLVWEIVTHGAAEGDLSGVDLSLADLSGVDLHGVDLSGAGLSGTNLSESDLSGVNLSGAYLSLAILRETNLNRANLSGGNLTKANLSQADLSQADLSGADLSEANLSGADLSQAKLSRAGLSEADLSGANLSEADLSQADLSQARLREANLNAANLQGANLSEADLSGAVLIETDLSEADLNGVDLSGANLSGATLKEVDLTGARLGEADLRWVDLRGTKLNEATQIDDKWRLVWEIANQGAHDRKLSGIDLIGADLRGADLRGAKLDQANLSGSNLSLTDLSGADLSAANLSETDLSGAVLIETNLSRAELDGAILSEADLYWANLSEARIDATTHIDHKWQLVWEIVNRGARGQDLNGTDLSGADLRGIDMRWTRLNQANLSGANLSETDLRGANLGGGDLRWSDLRGAKIDATTRIDHKWHLVWEIVTLGAVDRRLSGADLSGADLRGADLRWAKLDKSNLSGTDLRGANLSGTNLDGADLRWADLRGINMNDTTHLDHKWRMVWEIVTLGAQGRDLRRADLSGADLNGVDLSGADLSGADLSGDDLREANLREANLSGAKLARANLAAVIITIWPEGFDPEQAGAILTTEWRVHRLPQTTNNSKLTNDERVL